MTQWRDVFFNDTATTEIYTLSLHDALPICAGDRVVEGGGRGHARRRRRRRRKKSSATATTMAAPMPTHRSEEHTSELQSRQYLVCRLLLVKKKNNHRERLHIDQNVLSPI